MTLEEIVRDLEVGPRRRVICAREPWTRHSEAILVEPDADGGLPPGVREQGFAYLLEVHIARDMLGAYVKQRPRTLQERIDFVIYYAENDAFPDE